jgi:hypothetical protein
MICFLMSALLQPNRWKIISSGNYSVRLAGEYHSVTRSTRRYSRSLSDVWRMEAAIPPAPG